MPGSLAYSKFNAVMAPWTNSLDRFTHICLLFLYSFIQWVETQHDPSNSYCHSTPLFGWNLGNLAAWPTPVNQTHLWCQSCTPSKSLDPFTHIFPPPFLTHMQWKHTMDTNGHLIFRHSTPCWNLSYFAAWLTPNPTHFWSHGPLPSLYVLVIFCYLVVSWPMIKIIKNIIKKKCMGSSMLQS